VAEHVTYYAIAGREEPAGVLRRVKSDNGQRDEAFDHGSLTWNHTSMIYSDERGDGDQQLTEISAEKATRIVERIRRVSALCLALRS
jgi:hypothetical protein